LYLIKDNSLIARSRQKWLASLPLVCVFVAGHYGADLTHGANYVLEPLRPSRPAAAPLDEANAYHDVVYPILDARCLGCHNASDAKGGLNMEDPHQFAKGGRDGRPWDTTAEGFGLLMTRLHLPADDKKHMPPINTTQLSPQQLDILTAWVKDGSPFDKKVLDLPATDTLRLIASRLLRSDEDEDFDFSAADEKTIAALNTNYRTVIPLANGSPALAVDFYGASVFQPKQLQDLSRIKDQIVWLNLDKMPVDDNGLSSIATFRNLRRLNLDFTKITGPGLASLSRLAHLQSLSLSGDKIKSGDLDRLASLRSLHELYVWQTGLPQDAVDRLRQKRKDLDLITGFNADTVRIKLNPPRLETDARIIRDTGVTIKMRHFVPGAVIRYSLDGSDPDSGGRVYTGPFVLKSRSNFRAQAYRPGWLPSDPVSATFYTQKFPPDSIRLLLPVDSNYMKFRPTVLINADKGDLDYGSGKWLGFRKNGLSALLYYRKPVTVRDLTFSALVDIGAFIFPPVSLEVWGGPDERHLKKLGTLKPAQPDTAGAPYLTGYDITFPPQTVRCLKVL
ncbi:MAG TPA: FN3 associated domain-containing protein, partial [Puia sp.]|nr:FN3 associated domain-containing protein [Puia sp.]